jgi:hypothetical protein
MMVATLLQFGYNLYSTIHNQNGLSNDFLLYAKFIDPIRFHGSISTPHFIYPLLVAVGSMVFPTLSYSFLGASIVVFFQLLLANIIWGFLRQVLPVGSFDTAVGLLTIAAMMVSPINLLTLPAHNSYFGYLAITVYHNPPILICRPIALLHFSIVARVLIGEKITSRSYILCASTIVLATLMKPNYTIIMIPAAAIFAAMMILHKNNRLLQFIVFGTIMPGLIVLAWQFVFTYISPNADMGPSHVILAPFVVYNSISRHIFPKFVLSILFPLSVLIVYWKEATKDRYFLLGLLVFIAGAAQSYLLAEDGPRMYFGNFLWSGQLGLFLWFIVAIRFILQKHFADAPRVHWSTSLVIVSIVFILHVVSGVAWYVHETLTPGVYW